MKVVSVDILDDFLEDVDEHVKEVLSSPFEDIQDGGNVFKNIQLRYIDIVSEKLLDLYPGYKVNFNLTRKSPKDQDEPNFIHHDSMMGELTAILYLNKRHPSDEGTKLYFTNADGSYDDSVFMNMRYNRMIVFPSYVHHSRAVIENFGNGDSSRLVQVLFLNSK